jgi:CBS domain-containing protein
MKKVSDLLNEKGRDVWSLAPDATVYEAIEQMARKQVGALLIMKGETLVGIVSERDYARKVILEGKSSRETRVQDIMSHPVACALPDLTVEEALALMADRGIRHMPVMVEDKVDGVISMRDVVRGILADRELEIQQLTAYITSS